jgi:serine/threonine-protein kinase
MDDGCLNDDAVLDFVGGRLGNPARNDVERHLADCTICSRLVAVAAGYLQVTPANDHADDVVVRTAETKPGGSTPPETQPAGSNRPGSLPPGVVLRDTYKILRMVGRGGMGEVYEATHARLPGRYAVKVLHQHSTADPKAISRFRREAEVTSALRHPSIVAIVDFDTTPEGAPYLVMEYIEGGELARVIANEAPLPLERVLRIVDQIASALTAVHRRGIVHRDLKPQNIFLIPGENDGDERVKLVDFGISKVRVASVALTGERVLLGTPQYMAPEQAAGIAEVDERADQFALAAITYEMLTGRLAFSGDRVEVVVYRISHEDPPPLGPPWGGALDQVVRRALAKDPAQRYGSLTEFATSLRAAAEVDRAGIPVPPPALTTGERARARDEQPPSIRIEPTPAPTATPAPTPMSAPAPARTRRALLGGAAVLGLGAAAAAILWSHAQGGAGAGARPAASGAEPPALQDRSAARPPAPEAPAAAKPEAPAAPALEPPRPAAPAPPVDPETPRPIAPAHGGAHSRPAIVRGPLAPRPSAPSASATPEKQAPPGAAPPPPAPEPQPPAPPVPTPVRESKRGSLIEKL